MKPMKPPHHNPYVNRFYSKAQCAYYPEPLNASIIKKKRLPGPRRKMRRIRLSPT